MMETSNLVLDMSTGNTNRSFDELLDARADKAAELEIIRGLTANHRPDQVVAFGSRPPGKSGPRYFATVTAEQIWGWLPELWRYEVELASSSYWVLQPLRPEAALAPPTAANNWRHRYPGPRSPVCDAAVDGLNCVPLDLDVGRPGLPTAEDALKLIARAVLSEQLPPPTYMALSGRGAYAIWQLRDAETGGMPARTESNETRWRAILWQLVRATSQLQLEPDEAATNLARWMKLPGTTDTQVRDNVETRSGNKVLYLAFTDGLRPRPTTHTFAELEQALCMLAVPKVASSPVLAADAQIGPWQALPRKSRSSRTDRRDGSYVHAARVTEIIALNNARGGMPEGVRHMTLFHYFAACRALYACRYPGQDADACARADTYDLNARFFPPLPNDDVEAAIKRPVVAAKRRQTRAATIARHLGVVESEAEALGLRAIAPAKVRANLIAHEAQVTRTREEARQAMNVEIRRLLLAGWGLSQVAKHVGTDRQRVDAHRRKLREAGMLPKPAPRPMRQGTLPGIPG